MSRKNVKTDKIVFKRAEPGDETHYQYEPQTTPTPVNETRARQFELIQKYLNDNHGTNNSDDSESLRQINDEYDKQRKKLGY